MDHFILSAIDPSFGCSVLEAIIPIPDVDAIRALLGIEAAEDPDGYILEPDEARALAGHFGVVFEPISRETVISRIGFDLSKPASGRPYLTHNPYLHSANYRRGNAGRKFF